MGILRKGMCVCVGGWVGGRGVWCRNICVAMVYAYYSGGMYGSIMWEYSV